MEPRLYKLYQLNDALLDEVLDQVDNLESFIRGFAYLGCLKVNSDYLSTWRDIYLWSKDPRPFDDWMEHVAQPIVDDVHDQQRNPWL